MESGGGAGVGGTADGTSVRSVLRDLKARGCSLLVAGEVAEAQSRRMASLLFGSPALRRDRLFVKLAPARRSDEWFPDGVRTGEDGTAVLELADVARSATDAQPVDPDEGWRPGDRAQNPFAPQPRGRAPPERPSIERLVETIADAVDDVGADASGEVSGDTVDDVGAEAGGDVGANAGGDAVGYAVDDTVEGVSRDAGDGPAREPARLRLGVYPVDAVVRTYGLDATRTLVDWLASLAEDRRGMVHLHLPVHRESEVVTALADQVDAVVELRKEAPRSPPAHRWRIDGYGRTGWVPLTRDPSR